MPSTPTQHTGDGVPQANSISAVLSTLAYVSSSKKSVTSGKQVAAALSRSTRQGSYYLHAALLLGLVTKIGKEYKASAAGKRIAGLVDADKSTALSALILALPVMDAYTKGDGGKAYSAYLARHGVTGKTVARRTSCVQHWLELATNSVTPIKASKAKKRTTKKRTTKKEALQAATSKPRADRLQKYSIQPEQQVVEVADTPTLMELEVTARKTAHARERHARICNLLNDFGTFIGCETRSSELIDIEISAAEPVIIEVKSVTKDNWTDQLSKAAWQLSRSAGRHPELNAARWAVVDHIPADLPEVDLAEAKSILSEFGIRLGWFEDECLHLAE